MNIVELILELHENEIYPELVGEELELTTSLDEFPESLIDRVRENKIELIKFLKHANNLQKFESIPVAKNQKSYVLSSAQKRLFVLQELYPEGTGYNMPFYIEFKKPVDYSKVKACFQQLVNRHESLRTNFELVEEQPRQFIHAQVDFEIPEHVINASELKSFEEEFIRPFDLSRDCLLRASFVQVNDANNRLFVDMHHIVSDGVSQAILEEEFWNIYEGQSLAPAKLQYKDYSEWMNTPKQEKRIKDQETYWLNVLSGELPVLELPYDYSRSNVRSFEGGKIEFEIKDGEFATLKDYCSKFESTMFMTFLSVINIWLSKLSGQEDIIIGSPIASRNHADLEGVIGMFVNTLAIRNNPSGKSKIDDFFKDVRENTLNAFDNQEYGFDELVGKLDLRRDTSRNPVFDVLFVLQNQEGAIKTNEDYDLKGFEGRTEGESKFDLSIDAKENEKGLKVILNYSSQLLKASTVERFIGYLETIIRELGKGTLTYIDEINVLSSAEKNRLLHEFNDTTVDFPKQSLVRLFEEQVEKTPDNVALIVHSETFTYAEINEEANKLANFLILEKRIVSGDLIGIQIPRTENIVVAILAVLKTGAAYVPIDVDYPVERIQYMLEDSQCKELIDEDCLAEFRLHSSGYSTENLATDIKTNDLAYLIYTSGSTGFPKGVMIEHGSASDFIHWCREEFKNSDYEIVYGVTSTCFDLSIFELFFTLTSGKKLRLLPNALSIPDFLSKDQKILLNTVPSVVGTLLENSFDLSNITVLNMAGEPIPQKYIQCLDLNSMEVRNLYGPSEDTTYSTYYKIESNLDILIGKPIANTRAYILGKNQELLPVGVPGELCLSGTGLARGYMNKPELSAQVFISNPYAENQRLYKTGDLARWKEDGNIEYIGRIDNQVKVRGYRIEMGDIENALRSYPSIDSCASVVNSGGGNKRIIAYYSGKESISELELRLYLKQKLPEYMIPDVLMRLESIPLTNNGKIDRKALSALELHGNNTDYIAPVTSSEKKLIRIWEKLLGTSKIGMKDEFFALGGQSLLAIGLATLIEKNFSVKISLQDLFTHTTPEVQLRLIEASDKITFAHIERCEEKALYPLSSSQKRLYFLYEMAPESIGYNMPMVNFLGKKIDKAKVRSTLNRLITHHESLRTSFVKKDGVVYQKIIENIDFQLDEHVCASDEFAQYVSEYIRPFNLSAPSLFRSSIVEVKGTGYMWIVDLHHIIADGTSIQMLISDFMKLYKGEELPELPIRYRDFSEWQNAMLLSDEMESQKNYWMDLYKEDIPKLNFPSDRVRPSTFTFEGKRHKFFIDQATTAILKDFGRKNNGTIQMTLLSVLNVLLFKYTSQEDIVVGCGAAGRRHPDLENIVGMFVNTLAIRNAPKAGLTFNEFYVQVVENSISAYDNQDIQFEDVVEMLNVERDPSRNPLFDVCLIVQNFVQSKEDTSLILESELLTGEEMSAFNDFRTEETTKFDLVWFVEEKDEQIEVNLEYYAAIFDADTIEKLVKHFIFILKGLLENPETTLMDVNLIDEEETADLLSNFINGPVQDYAQTTCLNELFEEQCRLRPNAIVIDGVDGSITYEALNEKANRLANFLIEELDLKVESRVGVMVSRSIDMMVSIMAVLKAGGAYIPLDSEFPEDRLLYMIDDAEIQVLLTERNLVEFSNRLQWRSNDLNHLVCIDSNDFYKEFGGHRNELMRKDLWDHVGNTAEDSIEGGGWMNSYTGEHFTEKEMNEYSRNAYLKLKDHFHKEMKVLEIGCSSGITMFQIAPEVGHYVGTDLSSTILAKTKEKAELDGHNNVTLECLPADEIDRLSEGDFDLIIINSVIHCFDGHNYLYDVLEKAISKLKNTGLLFLGDLMDEDKRVALMEDFISFKQKNVGKGYRTKVDWSSELFVSRNYLNDLIQEGLGVSAVSFTEKIYSVENELTRYRYDALLTVDKTTKAEATSKKKNQFDLSVIGKYSKENPIQKAQSNNLAYVIYTSGSTGRPKGCMLEHRGVVNRIDWMWKKYNYSTSDVILQKTTFSFDVSVWEIFMPLCWGNKMIICHKDDIASPERISKLIEAFKVTCLHFVPSMLNVFISTLFDDNKNISKLDSLTKVITSGEALSPEIVKQWYQKMDVPVHNLYGPTEASVDVSFYETKKGDTKIPIGKPISNTQLYIVDDQLRLLPVGVIGQICIGGDGLARGYLNKPELSAERFVPNPFKEGEKIYKTGDVGRWLPDGNIEYIGRNDDQIKIRGYRIELGEIENVLNKHEAVDTSVLLAKENEQNEKELLAYYVPDHEVGHIILKIMENKRKGLPDGLELFELPNRMSCYSYNKTELEFLYEEIFKDRIYLKNGIVIPENGCVVDIGANLGMFTLFAGAQSHGVKVYSFEPLPPIFGMLQLNTSLYKGDYSIFNVGISNKEETVDFTYYPNATILSGRYADDDEVMGIVSKFIENTEDLKTGNISESEVDELLQSRLSSSTYECQLKTLSAVIEEHNIEQIDLLKIDVEKCEMDVLEGIKDHDWKRIKQIVLEIHDIENRLEKISQLLDGHGFDIQVEQNSGMANTEVYDVYAISRGYGSISFGDENETTVEEKQWVGLSNLKEDIKDFLLTQLPTYMIPSKFIQVEKMPLTSNGKVNKSALLEMEGLEVSSSVEYIAPGNETEFKLAEIWSELLGIPKEKISIRDNFFELGGHSLKATRLSSIVHKVFDMKIELRDFFKFPVLEDQAFLIYGAEKSEFVSISNVPVQKAYDLSPAQRRLWVVSQFDTANTAYNMPGVCEFEGDLNRESLERCFQTLIRRHEILRTVFKENDSGKVQQFILSPEELNFKIRFEDVRLLGNPDSEIKSRLQSDLLKPMNLSTGPLLRATLLQVADDKYIFNYVMHHIISDGWSMQVLVNELVTIYNEDGLSVESSLEPLQIQYKDYAAWQNNQLSSTRYAEDRAYWLNQFSGELPVLDLLGDSVRPAIKTYNGAQVHSVIEGAVVRKLKEVCHEDGATLFMGLLTSVNALLYKYTHQTDIITGTVIAGREHVDLENQIGYYLNTIALRSTFTPNDSFVDLLSNLKKKTLDGFKHQNYPFDQLVDELNLKHDLSRSALFDVSVVLQNTKLDTDNKIQLEGLKINAFEAEASKTSKFDLSFIFEENEGKLESTIEFNSDIFSVASIERMMLNFQHLLNALVSNTDLSLSQLDYIHPTEKMLCTENFNSTYVQRDDRSTIVELFEKQVEQTPDNVALVFNETKLTYKEINARANQLAHYLKFRYSIEANNLIGLKLEKREEILISMLAILKSGGAFLPIDIEYPQDRIEHMVSDSKCKLVIDEDEMSDFVKDRENYAKNNLDSDLSANQLAYVIYTSGSTGRPKGVMIEHASLVNLCQWHNATFSITENDNACSYAGISFDASVWELFPYLISGASLFIVPNDIKLDLPLLNQYFEENNITVTFLPTKIAEGFLEIENSSLRYLLVGGDKLSTVKSKRYQLVNNYGPTENTVVATSIIIDSERPDLSIGKPISNVQIYILDDNNELAAIGVKGEICISGSSLARGYLNNPELTAERFVVNPFEKGSKLYKTGDIGRWLQNGTIEYMGRKDDQVKIRGYRIELGEIENVLLEKNDISNAVVLAKNSQDGVKELVAYFVSDNELTRADLSSFLKERLPDYMVPSYFVQLDKLPLTANGKVDKKELPDPEGMGVSFGTEYVPARNQTEEKLIDIWSDILILESSKIGVRDNFFDLGGHSLKATRLAGEIHKNLGVRISLVDLFIHRDIESQAKLVLGASNSLYQDIPVIEEQETYPLSSAQKRIWILSQYEQGNISFNIPIAYQLKGQVNIHAISAAFKEIVARHESLRTLFLSDESGNVVQYIQKPAACSFDLEVIDLSNNTEAAKSAKEIIENDMQTPFVLSEGPLMRVKLIQLESDIYVLSCVMHHIISDGWSVNVLVSELLELYQPYLTDGANNLKPLRIQYKDYAVWQLQQSTSDSNQKSAAYWSDQFSGELPKLNLTASKNRPAVKTLNGNTIELVLNAETSSAIKHLSKEKEVTLFMSLLALVNVVLYTNSRQDDIIVGSPIAGRNHPDLTDQIGVYINTLALRTKLDLDSRFVDLLADVKETTMNAYEHQNYPFDQLVESLNITRDMSRGVLFDVWMVLQNTEVNNKVRPQVFSGLELSNYSDSKYAFSKFDLTFDFMEVDEELHLNLEYNTDLFTKERAQQFIHQFEVLTRMVISNPNRNLIELDSNLDAMKKEEQEKQVKNIRAKNLQSLMKKK